MIHIIIFQGNENEREMLTDKDFRFAVNLEESAKHLEKSRANHGQNFPLTFTPNFRRRAQVCFSRMTNGPSSVSLSPARCSFLPLPTDPSLPSSIHLHLGRNGVEDWRRNVLSESMADCPFCADAMFTRPGRQLFVPFDFRLPRMQDAIRVRMHCPPESLCRNRPFSRRKLS